MSYDLVHFPRSVRDLRWHDMAKIAEHMAREMKRLEGDCQLDRDGVAQSISDMAADILEEHAKEEAAQAGKE